MSRRATIELIKAETRRLEALGIVLGMLGLNTLESRHAGRPRLYQSAAEKKRAYRKRNSEKALAVIKQGRKKTPLEKVTDLPIGRKMESGSI